MNQDHVLRVESVETTTPFTETVWSIMAVASLTLSDRVQWCLTEPCDRAELTVVGDAVTWVGTVRLAIMLLT